MRRISPLPKEDRDKYKYEEFDIDTIPSEEDKISFTDYITKNGWNLSSQGETIWQELEIDELKVI